MSSRLKSSAAEWKPPSKQVDNSNSNSNGVSNIQVNYYDNTNDNSANSIEYSQQVPQVPIMDPQMMDMYLLLQNQMNYNDFNGVNMMYPSHMNSNVAIDQSFAQNAETNDEIDYQMMEQEIAKAEVEAFLDKNGIVDEDERTSLFHELMQVRFPDYVIPNTENEYVDQNQSEMTYHGTSTSNPALEYSPSYHSPNLPTPMSAPSLLQGLLPQGANVRNTAPSSHPTVVGGHPSTHPHPRPSYSSSAAASSTSQSLYSNESPRNTSNNYRGRGRGR
jgi:hypothetical protein